MGGPEDVGARVRDRGHHDRDGHGPRHRRLGRGHLQLRQQLPGGVEAAQLDGGVGDGEQAAKVVENHVAGVAPQDDRTLNHVELQRVNVPLVLRVFAFGVWQHAINPHVVPKC